MKKQQDQMESLKKEKNLLDSKLSEVQKEWKIFQVKLQFNIIHVTCRLVFQRALNGKLVIWRLIISAALKSLDILIV